MVSSADASAMAAPALGGPLTGSPSTLSLARPHTLPEGSPSAQLAISACVPGPLAPLLESFTLVSHAAASAPDSLAPPLTFSPQTWPTTQLETGLRAAPISNGDCAPTATAFAPLESQAASSVTGHKLHTFTAPDSSVAAPRAAAVEGANGSPEETPSSNHLDMVAWMRGGSAASLAAAFSAHQLAARRLDNGGAAERAEFKNARAVAQLAVIQNQVVVQYTADLHAAAARGDIADARLLLSSGLDINCTDRRGRTALHYAAGGGDIDAVRFLLSCNADVQRPCNAGLLPWFDAEGLHAEAIMRLSATNTSRTVPQASLSARRALPPLVQG